MLIPFKKEHLEVMDIREHEKSYLSQVVNLLALERGMAVTGFTDGRVVACGGVIPFGNGNAEIWQIPSIYVGDYIKEYVVVLKEWLFKIRKELDLTRMQTVCLDDELHNNWMKYIGFEREGVLKKYHDGADYILYARTTWV